MMLAASSWSVLRALAPVLGASTLLLGLLACSENSLSNLPKPDTDEDTDFGDPPVDTDEGVDTDQPVITPDDIPPPPPPEPVADAGPDRVYATGDAVSLDGSGSYDPSGLTPLTYLWTLTGFPVGSSVQITGIDTVAPSFVADVPGTFTFDLTVGNSANVWDQTPASVTITVEDEPVLEPVAVAGPDQTLAEGSVITLDGGGSFDPQGLAPLDYFWQFVQRPVGSTAQLVAPTTRMPQFTADADGTYIVELTVRNTANVFDSSPDRVEITAYQVVLPPVADAGIDASGSVGAAVTLNGNGSTDPQGLLPLTYAWVFTTRPAGSNAAFNDASSRTPSFTPDLPGTYTAELAVMNTANLWDPTPDKVDIEVTQVVIQEPVADAGPDFTAQPLSTIDLDGTASYDPAGLTPLTYQWTMVSSPAGSTTVLEDGDTSTPEFFADLAGSYVFQLTVQNSSGVWDTTPDTLTVEVLPLDGFYVQVTWDTDVDLDLHVLDGASAMWSDGDVCYCNMNPEWGAPGTSDNPSLDWDRTTGFGPETTTIDDPAAGTYHVKVHYYGRYASASCGGTSGFSCPVTTTTVRLYIDGNLAQSWSRVMDNRDQVWNVGSLSWPNGTVTTTDTMTTTTQRYCN